MGIEEVQNVIRAHKLELREFGVRELLLFGSVARGEGGPASDLDFLVELEQPSLERFMGLKIALEAWFSRKIDLGSKQQLKPFVRELVLRDALRVA